MPVQRQFYRDLQKWISGGMKSHSIFHKNVGLCSTYHLWGHLNKNKIHDIETDFETAGLNPTYPFNENRLDYNEEKAADSTYINPRRLAWIKEHANPRPQTIKSDNLN